MLEVRICKTRAELRAFFKIENGYLKEEARYLKTNALPEINPLCFNGNSAYILCLRDGKPVYRAFTGLDEAFCARTGMRRGYFSLFDGDADLAAARAVLKEIEALQKKWGAKSVAGPVSPDGSGFFMGVGEGDFSQGRGVFTGGCGEFKKQILLDAGYREKAKEGAYTIDVPEENPFVRLSKKAKERFSLEVRPIRKSIFSDEWKKLLFEVTDDVPEKDFFRFLEKVKPYIAFKHSFAAVKEGKCIGYILSLKSPNSIMRVSTLMTKKGIFTPPVALVLTDCVLDSLRKAGIKKYEASVIDERNQASFSILSHVNARKNRLYTQFIKNI